MFSRQPVSNLILAVFIAGSAAQTSASEYIASIIIDDIGTNYERAHKVATAPIPLTLAILPATNYAKKIARIAHDHGKEIMLHLPMQSISHRKASPGTLTLHMTHEQFVSQLEENLAAIPNLKGVNNHMGSLMTRHPGYMDWLMQTLAKKKNLYFIDSRTTDKSIAAQIAEENQVPNMQRDIFLDPDFRLQTIEQQFERFIQKAKTEGSALAIAHPHPNSMRFILDNSHRLEQEGIKLVPVSELLRYRNEVKHVTCTGTTCAGL